MENNHEKGKEIMLRKLEITPEKIAEFRAKHKKTPGFSLVEMAIAITLALGIMYYLLSDNSLFSASDSMNVKQDMQNLATYVKTYASLKKDHKYPATLDELLEDIPASESSTGRDESAVIDSNNRDEIVDPWGNEYEYVLDAGERSGSITSSLGGTGEVSIKF